MRRRITTLREERANIWEQMKALSEKAAAEGRDLDQAEHESYNAMEADLTAKGAEVDRLERELKTDSDLRSRPSLEEVAEAQRPERPLSRDEQVRAVRDTDEYRAAFEQLLRVTTKTEVPAEVRAALAIGSGSTGGYTVPTEFYNTLVESAIEFAVVRSLATVITTTNDGQVLIPTLASESVPAAVAEAGTYAGTEPTFGQKVLDAYKFGQMVKIADELVEDSAFDVTSLVAKLAGRGLGTITGAQYVTGTGSSAPNGVATAASAGVTMATGNTATIDIDALTDLQHSVVTAYRSRPRAGYLMKDSTLAFVRKIKTGLSGDKTTLWQPSVQSGVPDSLLGKPVYTDPSMAALGASSKVVLFGDFAEYWIRDVSTPTVKILQERYADTGQIGVRVSMRTDGELADAAAVKALVTSAT